MAAIAGCLIGAVVLAGQIALFVADHPAAVEFLADPSAPRLRAFGLVLLDEVNESPHIDADSPAADSLPICAGVAERHVPALRLAFGLMRGADPGRELYDTMVSHDVCVTVQDIPYNGGFATSWRSVSGKWFHGTITLDDDYIRSRQADVLAAMLVHEATHIQRAFDGESCDDRTDCEELPNGVELEEEIAAHAAEAAWWVAAYGEDGKRFAFDADYGENELAEAYQDGDAAFRDYVRELRNDPREGAGI